MHTNHQVVCTAATLAVPAPLLRNAQQNLARRVLLASRYLLRINELLNQRLVVGHFDVESAVIIACDDDACVIVAGNFHDVVQLQLLMCRGSSGCDQGEGDGLYEQSYRFLLFSFLLFSICIVATVGCDRLVALLASVAFAYADVITLASI